jgi:hypothetical protein
MRTHKEIKPSFQKTAQRSVAVYLEPSFGSARVVAKAGFHVAPALRSGLHGMTEFGMSENR